MHIYKENEKLKNYCINFDLLEFFLKNVNFEDLKNKRIKDLLKICHIIQSINFMTKAICFESLENKKNHKFDEIFLLNNTLNKVIEDYFHESIMTLSDSLTKSFKIDVKYSKMIGLLYGKKLTTIYETICFFVPENMSEHLPKDILYNILEKNKKITGYEKTKEIRFAILIDPN